MNDYDPILFTQRQVFGRDTASGTLSTNDDYNEHIRPFGSPQPPAVEYDMLDYLTNGAGRYAIPAVFPIIDDFFSSSIPPNPGGQPYNLSEIRRELNLTNNTDFQESTEISIWQYGTDTTSLDFPERAYIFGTTDFRLDLTNAEFIVTENGNQFIEGMQVIAKDDNFDFRGGAGPINAVANTVLLPAYDPYGLGVDPANPQNREVPIKFTTSTNGRTYGTSSDLYSHSDWLADDIYEIGTISIKDTVSGAAKLASGISQFLNPVSTTLAGSYLFNINSDPFLRYLRDDLKVIYGTPGDDNLTPLNRENDLFDPLPPNTPVLIAGGTGNDNIIGSRMSDELLGGDDSDVIGGRGGDDTLNGGANNDNLDGGSGEDTAVYFAPYTDSNGNLNYDITTDSNTKITTIAHLNGGIDGTDTLKNVEFGIFGGQQEDIGTLVASSNLFGIPIATAPRLIPLPLTDGIETTEYVEVSSTIANPNPNDPPTPPTISLTAPVAMLDGDVDYTLNILPYEPDTQYNVVYVIDTSISIDAVELQTIQDAYTDLTNFYINEGIAENINFGVVSFDSSGRFHTGSSGGRNLTADEAITALQDLTIDTRIGTRYFDGLNQADRFLLNSPYNPFNTTGMGYFFTDGQNSGDRFDMLLKARDARELANFQAIAYYSDLDTLSSNSLKIRDINWIDSNQGVFLDDISDLPTELLKSDLADDLELVNILLDGEVVETITPDQLTDSPLGLTYSGSVDELDVSIDAENVITAEVVFTDESNFATTNIDYTVTAGESEAVDGEGNDIPQSEDGNEDPFERIVDGGDSDDRITLGYADRGANAGAGGDEIIGNRRDNILDGGAGDDIISAYEGNDRITTGSGRDRVNGGSGIDTVIYDDVSYQDNNISLRKVGNSISYNNTDTLTDVEFIQLSDVRLSTDTQEITPVIEVAELSITEGNSDLTTARLDFNLSTPAPVDVVFDYSSEDIGSATAESDYIATSGQVTIPAGETSTSIDLEIIADRKNEELEQFALNFSNLSGADV